MLSYEEMTKGSAIDIPDLYKWMVIGAAVAVTEDGTGHRGIVVPCSVTNGFVSGSTGYVEESGITLVSVTMYIWSTGLNYSDCVVQQLGTDSAISRNQPISGIFGLIRTDPRFLE